MLRERQLPRMGSKQRVRARRELRYFYYEPRGLIVNYELFHYEYFSHYEAHTSTSVSAPEAPRARMLFAPQDL
eukprot:6756661-Prymnesium_polylepis.1